MQEANGSHLRHSHESDCTVVCFFFFLFGITAQSNGDNAGEMSPGSNTESYPAFAHIELRENPGKNLNQVTCPDRDSNPGHLVSRSDALTVTPQVQRSARYSKLIEETESELDYEFDVVVAAIILKRFATVESVHGCQNYRSFVHCCLNLWSAILGMGVDSSPLNTSLRIFFSSWFVFSLSVNTVFQTFFTSYLVDPGHQYQINSISELINLNYTFAFDSRKTFFALTYDNKLEGRSFLFGNTREALTYFLNTPNSAIFTSDELFVHNFRSVCGSKYAPAYHRLSNEVMQVHIGFNLLKDPLLEHVFTKTVRRLYSNFIEETESELDYECDDDNLLYKSGDIKDWIHS
ncbi:hypothetical protein ANN_00240 [Periplaneta americana]|uniref:Uncharacterized protein n=1 Tax=Periplaneta americana TaxID=6978 RepID=A0ABQ8TTF9_PERAM|nr:hypothetical protein ANN_00240 [Periplaneta americana]